MQSAKKTNWKGCWTNSQWGGGGVFSVSHGLPHVMLCNVVCVCCLVQQALPFVCGQQISVNSYNGRALCWPMHLEQGTSKRWALPLVDLSRNMPSLIECPYSLGVKLHVKHVEKVFF
jgi:hypothetical protein